MKRRTLMLLSVAATVGGFSVVTAPHAGAMPVGPDGMAPYRSTVVAAPVVPPRVVEVQAPLPKVTVALGDTLTGIGARTSRTWQQLAGWNHLPNPNLIYAGQIIVLPLKDYVPPSVITIPSSPPVQHTATPTRTYTPAASAPVVSYGGGSYTGIWACIAYHESGGVVSENTGNGYYGGLQFSASTWAAYGGTGSAANASASEQMAVANRIVAAAGGSYGAWPNTSRMCGV